MLPSFIEADAIDLLQYVDTLWRLSHLKNCAILEIIRTQAFKGHTEFGKRMKDGFAVFFICDE